VSTLPDAEKLLQEVKRIAEGVTDPRTLAQIAEAEKQVKAAEEAIKTPS
jgi:hypothetical protein